MTEDWFAGSPPPVDREAELLLKLRQKHLAAWMPFEDAMRELVMEHPAGLPRLRRRGRTHWAAAIRLMVVFFTLGFAAASALWWLL